MKNDKFCFNKGTGLIALVGIVLVALALVMGGLSGQSTSTSTRAAAGDSCKSGFSFTRPDLTKPALRVLNGKRLYPLIYEKQVVAYGSCEKYSLGADQYGNSNKKVNTGKICRDGVLLVDASLACKPACIYNGEDISEKTLSSIPSDKTEVPMNKAEKRITSYYLRVNRDGFSCIAERRDQVEGVEGRLTGKRCDFSKIVMNGNYPSAKVISDTTCNEDEYSTGIVESMLLPNIDNFLNETCNISNSLGSFTITQFTDSVADRAYTVGENYYYMNTRAATHLTSTAKYYVIAYLAPVTTAISQGDTVADKIGTPTQNSGCSEVNGKWLEERNGVSVGAYAFSNEYVACMGYRGQAPCDYGAKKYKLGELVKAGAKTADDLICGCRTKGKLLKYPVVDKRMNVSAE